MRYGTIMQADGTTRRVARLVLGTARFGGSISRDAAFQLMDEYFAAGGNALDTARVYCAWLPNGQDASERTVGEWIRSRGVEKEIFLMTKGGHYALDDQARTPRLSEKEIRADMTRSLEVLGLPRVDLYYLHRDDPARPVSEIMETLNALAAEGAALALGASNWRAARIAEANAWAAARGKAGFSASEIQWSYADFSAAVTDDTLVGMDAAEEAAYAQMGLPVVAYSCQSGGVFSCGYRPDLSDAAPRHQAYVNAENIRRYRALLEKCAAVPGMTPSRVMLEYITEHPRLNGFALIGASRPEQLRQSLAAMEQR